MSTRLPASKDKNNDVYSLEDLTSIHDKPENGHSDIYWIDAGIIEQLRPAGF
jgi:hypothetical protein